MKNFKTMMRIVSLTIVFVFILLVSAKDSNATFISPKYEASLLMSLDKVNCEKFRKSDIACLACNIYFEARSKSNKLQEGVALVTINRTRSDKFPNTVCGVVWDKYQFSWTLRKKKIVLEQDEWVKAIKTSVNVSTDPKGAMLRLRLTNKVLYFHNSSVNPKWAKNMKITANFDNHKFYEMKKDTK